MKLQDRYGFDRPQCAAPTRRIEWSVEVIGTARDIIGRYSPIEYTVRIADNDLDGYRW